GLRRTRRQSHAMFGCGFTGEDSAGQGAARRVLLAALQYQQRIDTHIEPVHTPVQVRPGCTSRRTDCSDGLPLFDAVTDLHVDARQVQEVGADAEAVVEHQRAAGQVQVRV